MPSGQRTGGGRFWPAAEVKGESAQVAEVNGETAQVEEVNGEPYQVDSEVSLASCEM